MMIPTDNNISTITDMRENTLSLLQSVQKKQSPTIIMYRNSPKAILLSIKKYNQLMEMVEDYLDEELALELEQEALSATQKDYISLKDMAKKHSVKI
ncbi:type II toxin-antitoxin system Phd/YefM family antitoxin [Patescibacteria group bacterium]|nr:type II toxin-antitoxin system Phd/YefM family antitoxin [Patescibacteria group bacterium]